MNILYCGDKNIADGVLLSSLSIAKNTTQPLNIYILTASVKTQSKSYEALGLDFADFLEGALGEPNKVSLFDITELFNSDLPKANIETRFTPCCMLRLYADLLPELPDKILYLDNDVLCRKDCTDFYEQDISGWELVGALDYYGKWFFRNRLFSADYLNSGVLLLNLKKIRESRLFEKCRERCKNKKMFMPDQSAINKLAKSKKILPRRFNEQRKKHDNTVFQHFTTSFRFFPYFHSVSVKPWDSERLHSVLKIYEYDPLISEWQRLKSKQTKKETLV
ncbi:MAG: hypothetical protein IJ027_00925 [Oscillospiraceae bacterium]|nr:hypothetical protein [Oscillospiraceae bacterium]